MANESGAERGEAPRAGGDEKNPVRRVLLVGEKPVYRLLGQGLARTRDLEITMAGSWSAGLRLAWQSFPDVVVVGAELADDAGLEMCRRFREDPITEGIPVIMLTPALPEPGPQKWLLANAAANVPVGIDPERFAHIIHTVLNTRPSRRVYPRVAAQMELAYEGGGQTGGGRTVNVSEGGLFVTTERPLELGARLTVAFMLPGGARIGAEARVVWRRCPGEEHPYPPGMGVRFEKLAPEGRAALAAFVAKAMGLAAAGQ